MRSQSEEDYLKAIYEQQYERGDDWVTTSALAQQLRVSPASVTEMLKKLAGREPALLVHERYHGVQLTEDGRQRGAGGGPPSPVDRDLPDRRRSAFPGTGCTPRRTGWSMRSLKSWKIASRATWANRRATRTARRSPGAMARWRRWTMCRLSDLPLGRPARVRRVLDDDPGPPALPERAGADPRRAAGGHRAESLSTVRSIVRLLEQPAVACPGCGCHGCRFSSSRKKCQPSDDVRWIERYCDETGYELRAEQAGVSGGRRRHERRGRARLRQAARARRLREQYTPQTHTPSRP